MFEDREPSIFPHPASALWIPVLLAVGWVPLLVADLVKSKDWAFGMAWGMGVALPCSFLTVVSAIVQPFRLAAYFLSRPEPPGTERRD